MVRAHCFEPNIQVLVVFLFTGLLAIHYANAARLIVKFTLKRKDFSTFVSTPKLNTFGYYLKFLVFEKNKNFKKIN